MQRRLGEPKNGENDPFVNQGGIRPSENTRKTRAREGFGRGTRGADYPFINKAMI
jgi:hypothetical protein